MNNKYNIKNFRVFDKNGVTFEFSPITILTGCNSSGKSSLVKSLLVFDTFLRQMRKGIAENNCRPFDYTLDFSGSDVKLGRFDLVQNDRKSDIVFGYDVVSRAYPLPLHVEYRFRLDEKDLRNQGRLAQVSITDEEGTLIMRASSSEDGAFVFDEIDFLPLKRLFPEYCDYAIGTTIAGYLQGYQCLGEESGTSDSEAEELRLEFAQIKSELSGVSADVKALFKQHFDRGEYNRIFCKASSAPVLKYMHDFRSVIKLPALEACNACSCKEEALDMLKYQRSKVTDEETQYYYDRIIDEFGRSDYELFRDFFLSYEESEGLRWSNIAGFHVPGGHFDFLARMKNATRIDYCFFSRHSSSRDAGETLNFADNEITVEEPDSSEYEAWLTTRDEEKLCFQDLINTFYDGSVAIDEEFSKNYYEVLRLNPQMQVASYTFFQEYVLSVLREVMLPDFTDRIMYHSSEKALVKRLYSQNDSSGSTDSFDTLLIKYVNSVRNYSGSFKPGSFINTWIREFRIGHSIEFRNTAEGLGFLIVIHRDENDREGHLLADEGYGITQLLSVMICIEVAMMSRGADSEAHYTIAVEEPEIHLHPRYQSLLANMFLDAYRKMNIDFIIETHSEYLIRKFQTFVALGDKAPYASIPADMVSIYYVFRKDDVPNGTPICKKIEIRKDGRLSSGFGPGFFDEADNLAMELLSIKVDR